MRRHPAVFIAPAPRPPRSLANVRLSLTAATGKQDAEKITAYLTKTMNERIMLLDGAMGTTIQQYKFTEEDFRGAPRDARGFEPRTMALTQPIPSGSPSLYHTHWQATSSKTCRRPRS